MTVILKEVEERIAAERQAMAEMEGLAGDAAITSELVRKCFQWNERGDGLLYALAHRDRFVCNTATGEMMVWGICEGRICVLFPAPLWLLPPYSRVW